MAGLTGNILITGGSGTLGHAIARTAERDNWDCNLTIYSRSELRQAQMRQKHPHLRYVLGDVRDTDRLAAAFAGHDIIIHAAAMKRIPECEAQPWECYQTNIGGSMAVVSAARQTGIKRVIGISTDKACRAITAYGASKLAMEKLFQAQPEGGPIFTLVRYGNVVASNGSVIPLWRERAAQGLPLTLTDPNATRFWMPPSAAVQLIVDAAYLPPGTILVPKMGSLSLAQLAKIVAPGAKQQTTGWRSVEKLHEDLVHQDEMVSETLDSFRIGYGERGASYNSDAARRLTASEFLVMLDEAESYHDTRG
jgi:UDP-N-acetylglucosamine 4,6-dehydratase